MCERPAMNRAVLYLAFVLLLFPHHLEAQFDVCALFGNNPLPFGTREFCTATGLVNKGGSDNNGCMILAVMEDALQGLSASPVCSADRQIPAAAVSLNGKQQRAASSMHTELQKCNSYKLSLFCFARTQNCCCCYCNSAAAGLTSQPDHAAVLQHSVSQQLRTCTTASLSLVNQLSLCQICHM